MSTTYSRILITGNFEILHIGHIRLFAYAKSLGTELIVGLCIEGLADEEILRRMIYLKENPLIDEIVKFTDIQKLVENVRPDALIKGREFANQENIEEEIMKNVGGRVIFSSGENDISESTITPKISNQFSFIGESILGYLSRNRIEVAHIKEILAAFRKTRILVVGDLILDKYIECVPVGLSQESHSIVARPIRERNYLGGAGIIAAHCAALGASASILSVAGSDSETEVMKKLCNEYNVDVNWVIDAKHPTILKQRFMSGKQVLFRLNRFRQEGVSKEIVKEIESRFSNLIERHDAVIFADFSYGVLNENNSQNLMKIAKARGLFTAADSQTSSQIGDLSKFIGADLITPTEREARQELRNQEGLVVLSHKLMEKLGSKFIMLKLGADGVLLSGEKLRSDYLPALNQEPVDVAGAGDSLLAISSLAITAGASLYVAGLLGNVAAAIQVSREGNLPITSSDVLEFFSQLP
jgi:rfaE bifunctional protein kinase chain/domain